MRYGTVRPGDNLFDLDEPSDLLPDDELPVRVEASPDVGTYVRERGGELYVWLKPVSAAWGTMQVTTEAPPGVQFEELDAGGFVVRLDRELRRPRELHITLRRWPWKKVRVRGVGQPGMVEGNLGPTPLDVIVWDSFGGGGGGGNGGGGNGGGGGH